MISYIRQCNIMSRRSIKHTFRNIDSLITGIMLPVVMLLLFTIIFSGAVDTGQSYINYIVPGVILVCVAYGASSTAMIVAKDMTTGLFNRFRSLPISLSPVLVGHVVGSIIRNCIATVLVFAVAFMLGFRPTGDAVDWLIASALLLLIITAISWFSTILGMIVKSIDAASGISFSVTFLPYLSSAFVPLSTLPGWLQGFAEHQPFTAIIDTLRGLLTGVPTDAMPAAFLWASVILIASYLGAVFIMQTKARG